MSPRQHFISARIAYVAIVLLATLTNLGFSAETSAVADRLSRFFFPPVSWRDVIDGIRNAALFAGLGSVWVLTSLTGKVPREIRAATTASFALSGLVEFAQLFSPVRNASIFDVFTNTFGGLAGAVATAMMLSALRAARGRKSYVGIPILLVAGPYALAVLCEALTPLFLSNPIPGLTGGPLERLRYSLSLSLPFDWTQIPILDIPLYAAAGFLLITLQREISGANARPWWVVALPLAPIIAFAHVLHGMMGLPIRWEAVATDVLSVAFGTWVAEQSLGSITQYYRGAARARLLIYGYMILLVIWGWRPLWPETRWEVISNQINTTSLTPLANLSVRADAFSAIHVTQQFLLYFPLGAGLAVWPLRRRGRWSNLWPAVVLAIVIEFGHIGIYDRMFDITNILLALAALAMGWLAVRRCGYEPYGDAISRGRAQARRA